MLESIDDGIGLISKKLEELGLADDTILIFSSDNGGETNVTSNAPLRGGKSQLYEGGLRVPFIVRWPNGKVPAGKVCVHPTSNQDMYPTLLEAANVTLAPSHKHDGQSILTSFRQPDSVNCARTLHWHYPLDKPHFLGGVSGGAIRKGDWKLIEHFAPDAPAPNELFHLAGDYQKQKTSPGNIREKSAPSNWNWPNGVRAPVPGHLPAPS